MAQWLYNSKGRPIAFVWDGKVFSRRADFIGRLDGNEVWNAYYKGEIVQNDRFFYQTIKGSMIRGTPGVPTAPGVPVIPGTKGTIGMLPGYRDVEIPE